MRITKPSLVLLLSVFALSYCKKNNPSPTPTATVDVYVSGNVTAKNGNSAAAYWKNGKLMAILDSAGGPGYGSFANGIAVNGTDVYLSGQEITGSTPFYWKNGTLVKLDMGGYGYGAATCIAINGTDLYVGGVLAASYSSNVYQPVYWKNGVLNKLSGGQSVNNIAFSGSDVYFAATIPKSGGSSGQAYWGGYWKNSGTAIIDTAMAAANYIAVYGTDVYLAGISFINGTGNNAQAVFTKNGKKTALLNDSFLSGIATNGIDVFTSGFAVNSTNNGYYPWVAKNTSITRLSADQGGTTSIGLNGSDVYVLGETTNLTTNKTTFQGYWKNGNPVSVDGGGYTSFGIGQMVLVSKTQ